MTLRHSSQPTSDPQVCPCCQHFCKLVQCTPAGASSEPGGLSNRKGLQGSSDKQQQGTPHLTALYSAMHGTAQLQACASCRVGRPAPQLLAVCPPAAAPSLQGSAHAAPPPPDSHHASSAGSAELTWSSLASMASCVSLSASVTGSASPSGSMPSSASCNAGNTHAAHTCSCWLGLPVVGPTTTQNKTPVCSAPVVYVRRCC